MTRDADLARRLDNLIRLGTIAAVDHARALCRVTSGGLLTDWLPWAERRAGTTRTWNPPTVGEQVLLLCPSGEPAAGIVVTGIYTAAHDQPSASASEHVTDYPDGALERYDHADHDYLLDVPVGGRVTLRCGASRIEIDNDGVRVIGPRVDLN